MNIHNIAIEKTSFGVSGGETCMVELVRIWCEKYKNYIYTPENGRETYQKVLPFNNNIEYIIIGKNIEGKIGMFFAMVYKTLKSLFYLKKFKDSRDNVIITHSSFFPSVIFAFLLKLKNPDSKWIAINHMLMPQLFRGFKGNTYRLPSIKDVYHFLNERLFFSLQKKADLLISVNSCYKKYLSKKNKNVKILKYGTDYERYASSVKIKDFNERGEYSVFLARIHEQKGIFELVDIARRVLVEIPDFRIYLVGDDDTEEGKKFKRYIRAKRMEDVFIFLGRRYGKEKYEILANSKILLFPSYYESFGIVYLEAISVGTVVVEYDLPFLEDHKFGVVKVPFKKNDVFADKVVGLLRDADEWRRFSREGIEYAKEFRWEAMAGEIEKGFGYTEEI